MGSPASPRLANLWLHQFESVFKAIDLKFFRRYVDDILCVIKKSELESIQREINELHSNLKFTYELESEMGQIPFLDMLLTHEGNSITSQWFIKPSNSGLILNFYAFAPARYKRIVVHSMI